MVVVVVVGIGSLEPSLGGLIMQDRVGWPSVSPGEGPITAAEFLTWAHSGRAAKHLNRRLAPLPLRRTPDPYRQSHQRFQHP